MLSSFIPTLLFLSFSLAYSFVFRDLEMSADTRIVGTTATYQAFYSRYTTSGFLNTAWNTAQVPPGSNITITFPPQFTLTVANCTSLSIAIGSSTNLTNPSGYTCSLNANTITVQGAIPIGVYIYSVRLRIGSILNPVPAVNLSSFGGSIGIDNAAVSAQKIQLLPAAFKSCSVTFNPTNVNQVATMIVNVEPLHDLGSTSTIQVSLPSSWKNDIDAKSQPITTNMICTSLSPLVSGSISCAGNSSRSLITASSILASSTTSAFSFGISNMVSPPTLQPSDIITITSFTNSYSVDTCKIYTTGLTAKTLNSLTITPTTAMTVNSNVDLVFTAILTDPYNQKDTFQIIFPSPLTPTYSVFVGAGYYLDPSAVVSGQNVTSRQNPDQPFSANTGESITIRFGVVRSPPSTKTSDLITFRIKRNGYVKMIGTGTIKAIASVLSGSLNPLIKTVNKLTTYTFVITMPDGLDETGMIKITFPTTITPTLNSACANLIGTNILTLPTCSLDSVNRIVTISGMSSGGVIPNQQITITISGVRNPSSVATTGTFTVRSYYTSDIQTLVSEGTISGFTPEIDTINSLTVSVVPSSYVVSSSPVTYTINFTTGNPIPQGGYIYLTIPSGIGVNPAVIPSNSEISISGSLYSSTPCTVTANGTGFLLNFSSPATAIINTGSVVSLKVSLAFTNPSDTRLVSSFGIQTFFNSFGIEQLMTGISVRMTTPSTMTSITISRNSNLNSNPATSYTFTLRQVPQLPALSKLTITFPQPFVIASNITCASLTSQSLTCTSSLNIVTITLSSLVNSNASFGVVLQNILNPPSYAPLSLPFTFTTKSGDDVLSYAQGSFISALANTQPSSFTQISGLFLSRIYGEDTTLQITVTPSKTPSYALVTIPNQFTIASNLVCLSWSCTSISSHLLKVTLTTSAQATFTISGMKAPFQSITSSVSISTYDSGDYKIDENLSVVVFSIACTLPCRTCSSNTSSCQSCYSNTSISSNIYLYQVTNLCYSSCPLGSYLNSLTSKCMTCNSNCLSCSQSDTNCLSCNASSTFPYLYQNAGVGSCRTACPMYFYPDLTSSPVACVSCKSPCYDCSTSAICLSCQDTYFLWEGSCIRNCPALTTIPNSGTKKCDKCSIQCANCEGTVTNCTSCASTAAFYNNSCVSVCPGVLVVHNGQCVSCSTNCLTCSISYTNCTSCNVSSLLPYLHNYACLSTCPLFHYNDIANGKCSNCSLLNIGCNNCTSATTCGSCNWGEGWVFLSSNNRCYAVTPVGYYNSSGIALPCSTAAGCDTCDILATNCTSCTSLNLQSNRCVANCIAGFVGVAKVCVACTNNCKTCTNLQSNCTTCVPNASPAVFLNNYQCVSTCPDYTYPRLTDNTCAGCVGNCETCTSASICLTCLAGSFLDADNDIVANGGACVSQCDFGYLGVNRICVRCTYPCDGCSQSLAVCTSCRNGTFFIDGTKQCVSECPLGLYPNYAQGNCTGCIDPCVTCSGSASNCTSCSGSKLLLNNACLQNCPDGYYPLNNRCNNCNPDCPRCSSSAVCLSCISTLLLYNGNCLTQCPSTHPVTLTGVCTKCSDASCISCNSLDQCLNCNYPSLLLLGNCVSSCPANYTSNSTHCVYTPKQIQEQKNETDEILGSSLSSSNLFPVPFTIGAVFIGVACIMSKFQHSYTFISGSLFAILSVFQMGALGTAIYLYISTSKTSISLSSAFIQLFIITIAVGVIVLLNITSLFLQSFYLRSDLAFKKWVRQSSNSCFYYFTIIIGLFITHKFKNILFCKLFGFDIFKAKLDHLQKFKIFNIFSFLSFIPSAAILFAASLMIHGHHIIDQKLMAYIDLIVLTTVCIILAILNSRKNDDFFEEKDDDGVVMHKRIVDSDSFFNEVITPFMVEDTDNRTGSHMKNLYETQRRFKSMDTISQPPSQVSSKLEKDMENISVQAAPVLQQYDGINFYQDNDGESDFSVFNKKFENIGIGTDKKSELANNSVHLKDISLQNVPQYNEQSIQKMVTQEDLSVQCGVNINNASIQYSAKPLFESISRDFIQSDEETQEFPIQIQRIVRGPIQKPDEVINFEQDFQENQETGQERKDQNLDRQKVQVQHSKLNQIYQNDKSRADGQSLIDSEANILIGMNKIGSKQESNNKEQKMFQQQNDKREQQLKQQKELIQMLSHEQSNIQKQKGGLDLESSMSFNVTRDLNEENKNIVFEQKDLEMESDGDDLVVEDGERENKETNILQAQIGEQVPSLFDKSRSTNFKSTMKDGRKPALQKAESNQIFNQTIPFDNSENDEAHEEINFHPIKPLLQQAFQPHQNATQESEDFNIEPRTNLANFLNKRKNITSAQQARTIQKDFGKDIIEKKQKVIRQNPLPLPRVQKLKTQESNCSSDSKKVYTMNAKKFLLQDKKIQFDEAERIDFKTQEEEFSHYALPRVLDPDARARNSKSQNRISNNQYSNPIHRELLSKQRFYDRTEKFLEKQLKKAEDTKKKIEMMEGMLQRPITSKNKGYMKQTHSSLDKKHKSELQKIYMNNPFEKKNLQ